MSLPVYYGIKNTRAGKVVCNVNGNPIHAGAHESYRHDTVLVGVNELLPAGAVLEHWSMNGHNSGGAARADLGGVVAPPKIHAG